MLKQIDEDNLVLIGISAYATSGKDTFAEIAHNVLKFDTSVEARSLSFASDLKAITNQILIEHLGIDCITCSSDVKKKIRPLLVGVGEGFRHVDEHFWVKTVAKKLNKLSLNKRTFVFLPDLRFLNEASWIKSHKNGFVISLAREGVTAPNAQEAKNIPEIASKYADLSVNWDNICDSADNVLTNPKLVGIVTETLRKIECKLNTPDE